MDGVPCLANILLRDIAIFVRNLRRHDKTVKRGAEEMEVIP